MGNVSKLLERSVYQLSQELDVLQAVLEESAGELTSEVEVALDTIEGKQGFLLPELARWKANLEAEAAAINVRYRALADLNSEANRRVESVKALILQALGPLAEGDTIREEFDSVFFTKSWGPLGVSDETNIDVVPDEYIRLEPKLDKTKILEAVKANIEIPGVVTKRSPVLRLKGI